MSRPIDPGTFGRPQLRRAALVGLGAGVAVVVGAELGGRAFVSELPGAWFFGTPGGPLGSVGAHSAPPALALLLVFGGLIVMTRNWVAVLRGLRRSPGTPVRLVVGVLALWIVPLVVAPPLFSRDAYSYAGQGELVSHHINPYQYGTGVLGATPFNVLGGPVWSNSPSPYGPVFLSVDGAVTGLTGHEELADLVALRALALGGLALIALAIPTLARAARKDPAEAVVLGAGSPLVLTALVGGMHNDALMVGLMVAGLAVARRYGPVRGIVLCALAAGVKSPALLAVGVIGWTWPPAGASLLARAGRALGALGIAAAVLGAASAFTRLGWGWTRTIGTADQVSTGVTPLSSVAHLISGACSLVGISVGFDAVRSGVDVAGLLVAAAACAWLVSRSARLGPVRTIGLALLVVALFSPILWAWYLSWGLVTLAAVATGRLRQVLIALAALWTFIGASAVDGIFDDVVHLGALSVVLLALGLAGCIYLPIGQDRGPAPSVLLIAGRRVASLGGRRRITSTGQEPDPGRGSSRGTAALPEASVGLERS
ncbi:MAG TPA: polyprenol phosphomannose-dependent alpha 1,6 mannosyltransferase MptB [Acidimicrobiales bacterium]|jgi:hypothetical protein